MDYPVRLSKLEGREQDRQKDIETHSERDRKSLS